MRLNPIANNQNEVQSGNVTMFFSYKTPVAYINHDTGIAYQTKKKWSVTTSKHIKKWLESYSAETVNLIDQSFLDSFIGVLK